MLATPAKADTYMKVVGARSLSICYLLEGLADGDTIADWELELHGENNITPIQVSNIYKLPFFQEDVEEFIASKGGCTKWVGGHNRHLKQQPATPAGVDA